MKLLSLIGKIASILNSNKIIILLIIILAIALYWTRYQIVEIHDKDTVGFYRIDRLTGEILLVRGKRSSEVEVKDY